MSNRPQQSDPIRTMFGPVTVTARPVRKGHQLARAMAAALTEAADHAEGVQ
jgi:thiamine pyrophosphate-dependent acetolactate synthase large subunit-like protein